MKNYGKNELKSLRDEIREMAAEGRAHNPRIQAAEGPERHALRQEKASVGRAARVLLLTYALLRGVPYRTLEANCREDGIPFERKLLVRGVAREIEERVSNAGDAESLVERCLDGASCAGEAAA